MITLAPYLSPRRLEQIDAAVSKMQASIAAGIVPNKFFTDTKDIFSRAVDEAAEAFLKTGPHIIGRDGQPHHQSDWWLAAYDVDAFSRGIHGLPVVLKRAQKAQLTEYASLLAVFLPLRDMLETAKPLIKKRGEMPVVKSAKQIADEADQMTCQCCGRGIFAATGTIAHHGYERPGTGWQTASCMGAKELPFEVDRTVLAHLISRLQERKSSMKKARSAVAAEQVAIDGVWTTGPYNDRKTHTYSFTRANFNSAPALAARRAICLYGDFDDLLKRDLASRDRAIKILEDDIELQRSRWTGWKQTHKRVGDQWVAL